MHSVDHIELLDKTATTFPVEPSATVYFGAYPYRLSLNSNFPTTKRGNYKKPKRADIVALHMEIKTALNQLATDRYRFKLDLGYLHGSSHVYFKNITDLHTVAAAFSHRVRSLSGPLSVDHLELLQNRTVTCVLKNRLWHQQYDCKVSCWVHYLHRNQYNVDELVEYVADNIDVYDKRPYSSYRTFYCDFEQFINLLPFVKLSFSQHRLTIEKCVLR